MKKKIILILMPLFQITSTAYIFRLVSIKLGEDCAILIGFLFAQVFWSVLFPLLLLGKKDFFDLFKQKESFFMKKNILFILLLVSTVIGSIVMYLVPNILKYSTVIFFLGIPLTIINSTCEELLWRGTFLKIFGTRMFFSIIYPSIFFALYHISSQMINLEIRFIETLPLVLMALPLGLLYSVVAYRCKSIKWVSLTHSLSGIIAFGVPLSTSLAKILGLQ